MLGHFLRGPTDDVRHLHPQIKQVGQISVGALGGCLGLRIELLSTPFGGTGFDLPVSLGFSFAVLRLIPISDVVNLADGMGGTLLRFLLLNVPPAKFFLGDGGACLVGFFVASAMLGSSQKSYIGAALLVIMIAPGLPIIDTVIAFCRRAIKGVPVIFSLPCS